MVKPNAAAVLQRVHSGAFLSVLSCSGLYVMHTFITTEYDHINCVNPRRLSLIHEQFEYITDARMSTATAELLAIAHVL